MKKDRLMFFIRENLPSDNVKISREQLLENVAQDMLSTGESVFIDEIFTKVNSVLNILNEKQYVVMFGDDTVAMTNYGATNWYKEPV